MIQLSSLNWYSLKFFGFLKIWVQTNPRMYSTTQCQTLGCTSSSHSSWERASFPKISHEQRYYNGIKPTQMSSQMFKFDKDLRSSQDVKFDKQGLNLGSERCMARHRHPEMGFSDQRLRVRAWGGRKPRMNLLTSWNAIGLALSTGSKTAQTMI